MSGRLGITAAEWQPAFRRSRPTEDTSEVPCPLFCGGLFPACRRWLPFCSAGCRQSRGMQIPGHRDRPPVPRVFHRKKQTEEPVLRIAKPFRVSSSQIPDIEKPLQKVPHRSCSDTELPCRCTPTVCQRHGMSASVCVGSVPSGTGAADSQKHSTSQIQKRRHNVTTRAISPG